MKIAATLEYCGARYSGWQRQKHAQSIQQLVESALSEVADQAIHVHCSGRTDTGVHALHQVIHFESSAERPSYAWVLGSNSLLPDDISLQWADSISEDFHARFSAKQRSYRYIILNRKIRPAIGRELIAWEHRPLDIILMQTAAEYLLGVHDFSSFRAAGCQAKTAIREIMDLQVTGRGDFIAFQVTANAFLQHMIRNIAGVLMTIGCGDKKPEWAREVLEARDRNMGSVTAPASGLYFIKVEYPEKFKIPGPVEDFWTLLK